LYLFILESIGTSELILIGIVALIFLGPRKLPEIARKIGKIMAEFRTTTQDFKQTWEKEVNFEEETRALNLDLLDKEETVPAIDPPVATENRIGTPEIKQIDKESFDRLTAESAVKKEEDEEAVEQTEPEEIDLLSDKRNWL